MIWREVDFFLQRVAPFASLSLALGTTISDRPQFLEGETLCQKLLSAKGNRLTVRSSA